MPKVPEQNTPTFNTTNVPGVQFPYRQEFGKPGQALAGLGQDITNASSEANTLINEVNRQYDITQSDNHVVQDKLWSDQRIRELKNQSPDGYYHDASTATQDNPAGDVVFDGDKPRTIADQYYQEANDRYTANQDKMSPLGATMYRSKAMPEIAGKYIDLNGEVQTMKLKAATAQADATDTDVFKEFNASPYDKTYGSPSEPGNQSRPDLSKFADYAQSAMLSTAQHGGVLNKDTGELEGGIMNPTQVKMATAARMDKYADAWLNANYTKIMEDEAHNGPHASQDIQNLLDIVKGNDPQSQAYQAAGKVTPKSALSSDNQTKWEDKLIKMQPAAASVDTSEYKLYESNYISKAAVGQASGSDRANLNGWMNTMLKTGTWSHADYIQHLTDVTAAEAKGKLVSPGFDIAPTATQHAITENVANQSLNTLHQAAKAGGLQYPEGVGAQVSNEVNARMIAPINEMDKQKKADMPAFLAGQDPLGQPRNGIASRVAQLDWTNPQGLEKSGLIPQYLQAINKANQINFGESQEFYRPISKNQSATLGAQLQQMSPAQSAQSIQSLKNSFGTSYGSLMDTMIKDGSVPIDYKTYGTTQGLQALTAQMAADRNAGDIKMNYETATGKKYEDLLHDAMKFNSADVQARVAAAPLDTDQAQYQARLTKQLANAAAQKATLLPSMQNSDLLKSVKDEAFKNFPVPTDIGNRVTVGGWKTPISSGPQVKTEFPPGLSDTQSNILKTNLAYSMSEQGLRELGAAPPKGTDFGDKAIPMYAKQMAHVSLVNGKDRQGQDCPGYIFSTTGVGGDGKTNGSITQVPDKNGNPIFVPLRDLLVPRNAVAAPKVMPSGQ